MTGCCSRGISPRNIASVGHSVGGNLAVSLALRLRDEGSRTPGRDPVDLTVVRSRRCPASRSSSNADRDKLLSRPLLEFFRSCLARRHRRGLSDPRVNLLNADLSGLPPIAVFYGTRRAARWRSIRIRAPREARRQ